MKKFLVIGLGNFGYNLACELYRAGHEVIAVDNNENLIDKIKDSVSHAIITDAKRIENIRDFISDKTDAVILNLGESLEQTVLTMLAVKNLGVRRIIVKVASEEHGMILQKLGATEIIVPERDYAKQMSKKLTNENLLDYLPMSPDYGIYEMALPDTFAGKRMNELNIRKKYNVSVIAIRDIFKNSTVINPAPDFRFLPDMVLYLLGKSDDVMSLKA